MTALLTVTDPDRIGRLMIFASFLNRSKDICFAKWFSWIWLFIGIDAIVYIAYDSTCDFFHLISKGINIYRAGISNFHPQKEPKQELGEDDLNYEKGNRFDCNQRS